MVLSRDILAKAFNRLVRPRPWYHVYASLSPGDERETSASLAAVLRHAASSVPFYRSYWQKSDAPLDLRKWPVIRKEQIQGNVASFVSEHARSDRARWNSSGGSTGMPVRVLQDAAFSQWCAASEHYFYVSLLAVPDYETASTLLLWGSERDLARRRPLVRRGVDWLLQRETFNSFDLTDDVVRDILRRLAQVSYSVVKGYAGSLCEISRFGVAQNAVIRAPRAVYSSAEQLRPEMRRDIERFFGTKVHDFYGSREVGAIAGECKAGSLHIFSFNNIVELLDEHGQPVPEGTAGRVTVTTLHNYSMPLIRYEVGDVAIAAPPCPCGNPLPCLSHIEGRITDQFVTLRGGRVSGEYFTHLFYFNDTVLQFQVVQHSVDAIEILYVPRPGGAVMDRLNIERQIRRVMGKECRVLWSERDDLPLTPQGKRLFTYSHVAAQHAPSAAR